MGVRSWAVIGVLTLLNGANAGIYHPDTLLAEDWNDRGEVAETGFATFLLRWGKVLDIGLVRPDQPPTADRLQALARLNELQSKLNRSDDEATELISLHILLNQPDEALQAMKQLERSFLTETHRARIYQSRSLEQAYRYQEIALEAYDFPAQFLRQNAQQRQWYQRIERDYYLPWLLHRKQEDELGKGRNVTRDQLDTLFPPPLKPRMPPIRWVGESGKYELGKLAAVEQAKLPPEGLAIVQQMLLWNPNDLRLCWLLAELYILKGDYLAADYLLDRCVWSGYSPAELLEHRELLRPAVESIQAERKRQQDSAEAKRLDEANLKIEEAQRERRNTIIAITVSGFFIVMIAYWQTKEIVRKWLRSKRSSSLE